METGPDVASSPSYSVGEGENNIAESAITAEEEGIRVGEKKGRRGADSLFPESRADLPAGGPGRKLHGVSVLSFSFLCFLSSFSPERQFPNRKTKNGRHTRQFLLLKNESVTSDLTKRKSGDRTLLQLQESKCELAPRLTVSRVGESALWMKWRSRGGRP